MSGKMEGHDDFSVRNDDQSAGMGQSSNKYGSDHHSRDSLLHVEEEGCSSGQSESEDRGVGEEDGPIGERGGQLHRTYTSSGEFERILEAGRHRLEMQVQGEDSRYGLGDKSSEGRLSGLRRVTDHSRKCDRDGGDVEGEGRQIRRMDRERRRQDVEVGEGTWSGRPKVVGKSGEGGGENRDCGKISLDPTDTVRGKVCNDRGSQMCNGGAREFEKRGEGNRVVDRTTEKIVESIEDIRKSLRNVAEFLMHTVV